MIRSICTWGVPFLIVVLFSSCKEKIIITNYETGEKFEEYQYTGDSLKNGFYKRYSTGGVLMEEATYVEGKLNGERLIYNANGDKEILEIYESDVLNGQLVEYHPNGNIKLEGTYKENVLEGIVKVYYPSGKIKEEISLKF
mgnify:CR=1 FL=1